MTSFRIPRRIIKTDTYGPEPVGKAGAAVLQEYADQQLDGRAGFVHFGMKGEANETFSGWAATPQTFRGNAQMGANAHAHVQDYPALPNAAAPSALPQWLQDWTQLEGLTP